MIDAGRAIAYLDLDTTGFGRGFTAAKQVVKDFGNGALSASDKIKSLGGALTSVGKTASTVSAGLVTMGGVAIKQFASFDDAIRQVQATMGLTAAKNADEIAKLTDAAKNIGTTTSFSAGQAAEALNYLAAAGYDVDKSVSALPNVLKLAQAGGTSLGTASDLVTGSMTALGLSVGDLGKFCDQLAVGASASNASVTDLGQAILTVGGTAKGLSGGVVELNTALGILADNGIKAAEGGTAIRNIILSLSAPTDQAAKKMKELKLSVYDAEDNMRGLNEIFGDLDTIMTGWTQKQRTDLFSTLFNNRDLKSAEALIANYGERWNELSAEIEGADGAAQQMADTMEGGIGGSFRSLSAAVQGLAIEFGENLAPTVQDASDWVTDLVRRFSELPESTQSNIVNFAAWTAAVGPMILVGGKLIGTIGTLIGVMSGPVGWVTLGVAGVAGLTIAMQKYATTADNALEKSMRFVNQDDLKAFKDAFSKIDMTISPNVSIDGDPDAQIAAAVGRLKKALQGIEVLTDKERDEIVAMIGEDVDPIIQALMDAGVDPTTGEGAAAGARIVNAAAELKTAIEGIKLFEGDGGAQKLAELINADKQTIIDALMVDGMTQGEAGTAAEAIQKAGIQLTEAASGLTDVVPDGLITEITDAISGDKSALIAALGGLGLSDMDISAIITSLTSAQTAIGTQVSSVYDTIYGKLTDGLTDTEADKEELKQLAQTYFDDLMSNLDLNTEAGQEYATSLQTLQDETLSYIETMSGKSTGAVAKSKEDLDKLAGEARQLYGEIMGMTAEAGASNNNTNVKMVKAGRTSAPEKVTEALDVTYQEYGLDVYDIRERAAQMRKEADEAWAKAWDEAGRIDDAVERQRAQESANQEHTDTTATIDETMAAEIARAEASYRENLNALFAGLAANNPEIAARYKEMLGQLELSDLLKGVVDSLTNGEALTEDQKSALSKAVTDGLLEGVNPDTIEQDLLTPIGQQNILNNLIRSISTLPDEIERTISEMDTGTMGMALQEAIEIGMLSGTDIDLGTIENKIKLLIGQLDVPQIVRSAVEEQWPSGEGQSTSPVTVAPPIDVDPEVDASSVPGAISQAVRDEIGSITEPVTVDVVANVSTSGDGDASGAGMVADFASGIKGGVKAAASAASTVGKAAANALDGASAARTAGANVGAGFAAGMQSKLGAVIARAAALVRAAIGAINKEAEINSPSRKTTWSGEQTGEGYVVGMKKKVASALAVGKELGTAGTKGIEMARTHMDSGLLSAYQAQQIKLDGLTQPNGSQQQPAARPSINLTLPNAQIRKPEDAKELASRLNQYMGGVSKGWGD